MNNYDFVGEFNQGVAIVIKDNLYGAVTIGGYEIIPPIYDYISPFNDGYAEAIQKGECKTLDLSGKEFKNTVPEQKKDIKDNSLFATTEKYDSIERLNNGICIVSRDKKYGCINQIGSIIIPLKYESLVCQNKLLIAIRYDVTDESHKIGIINFQESEIVPFTHLTFCRQKIEFVIKPEIIFYKVIRWGAYSLQGKKFANLYMIISSILQIILSRLAKMTWLTVRLMIIIGKMENVMILQVVVNTPLSIGD